MKYNEMDPDIVKELLKDQVDVLTPLVKKEEIFLYNQPCIECGERDIELFINPTKPFSQGSPLPNRLVRCLTCQTEFDPNSGIITKAGITDA